MSVTLLLISSLPTKYVLNSATTVYSAMRTIARLVVGAVAVVLLCWSDFVVVTSYQIQLQRHARAHQIHHTATDQPRLYWFKTHSHDGKHSDAVDSEQTAPLWRRLLSTSLLLFSVFGTGGNALALEKAAFPECSTNIVVLHDAAHDRDVVMVGTAHISADSAELVRRTIRTVRPDTVMIELDSKRARIAGNDLRFEVPKPSNSDAPLVSLVAATAPLHTDTSQQATQQLVPQEASSQAAVAASPTNAQQSVTTAPSRAQSPISNFFTNIKSSIANTLQAAAGRALGGVLSQFYKSTESLGFTAGGEFKAAVEESTALGAKVLLGDRDADVTLGRLASAIASVDKER